MKIKIECIDEKIPKTDSISSMENKKHTPSLAQRTVLHALEKHWAVEYEYHTLDF